MTARKARAKARAKASARAKAKAKAKARAKARAKASANMGGLPLQQAQGQDDGENEQVKEEAGSCRMSADVENGASGRAF
jgi:hypothetical protein